MKIVTTITLFLFIESYKHKRCRGSWVRILFLVAEPFVQVHTGKRSRVLVTCAVAMSDSVPQGDVAFFLFQMTHVFQSPDHCHFPGKLEENNITYESKQV